MPLPNEIYTPGLQDGRQQNLSHLVNDVKAAIDSSHERNVAMQLAINAQWGSKKRMESVLDKQFGVPSEQDMFMAKKIVHEQFFNQEQKAKKTARTFIVSNPI